MDTSRAIRSWWPSAARLAMGYARATSSAAMAARSSSFSCQIRAQLGAEVAAEKLRELIAAIDVPEVDEPITASFGVAAFPEHGAKRNELLDAADRALYAAKASGRDCVKTTAPRPAESQAAVS